jgi:F0F1-type ATP synthase assembly protein I
MTQIGGGDRPQKAAHGSEIQRASSDALGHGFTIAAAIGVFLWAGDRADKALGTSPVFALSGMLLGAAAGFYRLYAHLVLMKRAEAEKADGEAETAGEDEPT